MPAYEYTCTNCQAREVRITSIGERSVICAACGQVMLRQMDLEILLASYAPAAAPPRALSRDRRRPP